MTTRPSSALDRACDAYVLTLAAQSPTSATAMGIAGFDAKLEDFTPEYFATVAAQARELLAEVDALEATGEFDAIDMVTARVLRDRLGVQLALSERGEDLRALNNIDSPLQRIRDTFFLMATDSEEALAAIRSRLGAVAQALEGHCTSLAAAASHGRVAPQRQVDAVIAQAEELAGADSAFRSLPLPQDTPELVAARAAAADYARWLREELRPQAGTQDGVGRELYELYSHEFVGARVDLDEAYAWGFARLDEIIAEQHKLAEELYGPGTSVEEACQRLDADERYLIHGREALVEWMQRTADDAVAALDGREFAIPQEIHRIDCKIDPAGTGGIFYTPPSEDFTRPGAMWWSVPPGEDTFHTWAELTTVYHEGVPGHHLQLGEAMTQKDNLNAWRRLACWNSGHGEGWALYAEQLMADCGFHEDPATRMGMLAAQRLRAARVVLDIGVHLGMATSGGGAWDFATATEFFRQHSSLSDGMREFEVMRYFGWPGQAPSYALGQRLWQQLRDDAVTHGMDVPTFHREALAVGSIPMPILAEVVLAKAQA